MTEVTGPERTERYDSVGANDHESGVIGGRTAHERRDPEPPATAESVDERDRAFAGQIARAGLVWALIWSVIIASLFLFGDTISAFVV